MALARRPHGPSAGHTEAAAFGGLSRRFGSGHDSKSNGSTVADCSATVNDFLLRSRARSRTGATSSKGGGLSMTRAGAVRTSRKRHAGEALFRMH